MKTSAAQTAKAVRTELKKAFPTVKFSVTSDTFSMGDAVRIYYTDGPLTSKVDAVVKKYQYGQFNSMEDIYENTNSIEGLPQVKYVTVSRDKSEAVKAELLQEIQKTTPGAEGFDSVTFEGEVMNVYTAINRMFSKREY